MSTKTAHTAGPWKVFRTTDGEQIIGIGQAITGDGVTDPRFGLWCSGEEREANAALIASAPDLLAERDRLKAINAELVAALEKCAAAKMPGDARCIAHRAIAKATGAQP